MRSISQLVTQKFARTSALGLAPGCHYRHSDPRTGATLIFASNIISNPISDLKPLSILVCGYSSQGNKATIKT